MRRKTTPGAGGQETMNLSCINIAAVRIISANGRNASGITGTLQSIGLEIEVQLAHIFRLDFLTVAARGLDGIQVLRGDIAGDVDAVEA